MTPQEMKKANELLLELLVAQEKLLLLRKIMEGYSTGTLRTLKSRLESEISEITRKLELLEVWT